MHSSAVCLASSGSVSYSNRHEDNVTIDTRDDDKARKPTMDMFLKIERSPQVPVARQIGNLGISPQWSPPVETFQRSAPESPQSRRLFLGDWRSLSARWGVPADPAVCPRRALLLLEASRGGSWGRGHRNNEILLNQPRPVSCSASAHVPSDPFILCILPNDGDLLIGGNPRVHR